MKQALGRRLGALILGALLVLLALELLSRALGGYARWSQQRRNVAQAGAEVRILALGESTTQMGGPLSWPSQLQGLLQAALPESRVAVYNGAALGVNSSFLVDHVDEQLATYRPQIVLAMIGANDDGDYIPLTRVDAPPVPSVLRHVRVLRLGAYVWARLSPPHQEVTEVRYEPRGFAGPPQTDPYTDLPIRGPYERGEQAFRAGRREEAIAYLEAALRETPQDPRPFLHLAELYQLSPATVDKALPVLRQVCSMAPQHAFGYVALARALSNCGRSAEAQQSMALALGKDYVFLSRHRQLARAFVDFLKGNAQDDEAARFFACMERNTFSPDVIGMAYAHWMSRQRPERAAPYRTELARLRRDYFQELTRSNYQRLYEKVRSQHARLVCVGYANRDPRPLQQFFADHAEVQVVSNLEPFAALTAAGRYDELFIDKCNGDMGHGTPLGNYYLAYNVARDLLAGGLGDPKRLPLTLPELPRMPATPIREGP